MARGAGSSAGGHAGRAGGREGDGGDGRRRHPGGGGTYAPDPMLEAGKLAEGPGDGDGGE